MSLRSVRKKIFVQNGSRTELVVGKHFTFGRLRTNDDISSFLDLAKEHNFVLLGLCIYVHRVLDFCVNQLSRAMRLWS